MPVSPALARRAATPGSSRERVVAMLNKVPEVTLYFWIIKILATTVGETAADYLDSTLGLGLTATTLVMSMFLAVVLFFQFRLRQYVPGVYWLAVVLISVVGTLITDNLVDNFGVALTTTTIAFSIALIATFAVWYASERTLSIHTIVTTRREAFYWLAVLFTFALGTAAGDLVAEKIGIGYWKSALMFGGLIGVVYVAHRYFRMNAILAFWLAYILTRPLGASIGDYLSQPRADLGLGLGTTVTSAIFLLTIAAVVVYLTISKTDRIEAGTTRVRASSVVSDEPCVLVVPNKAAATPALVEAVRARAAAGAARFVMLIPNPDHVLFDRNSDASEGEHVLAQALPPIEEAAGGQVEGALAASPNAYDDIVEELNARPYDEIILETIPHHVSHWLHTDLPQRVAQLGYRLTTVTATA